VKADWMPRKPVVIILDMAKGYGWEPGSFGYDVVAKIKKLKDAVKKDSFYFITPT
jgi:hypothetical protein